MLGSSWFAPQVQSVGDFVFFQLILKYVRHEVRDFGIHMLGNVMTWVGAVAIFVMTLWVFIHGYRIMTGQSRDSLMLFVTNSLRAVLILSAATTMGAFGTNLHQFLAEDLKDEIHFVITNEKTSPEASIDKSLAWMQVALSSIDVIQVAGDETLDSEKTRALYMVGFGTGGPAIVGGTMLLLNEIALALFVGLGPLFILCLLFDQTKPLFGRWLYYGIGTMFSMAVLSAMVSIALEMVIRVSSAFWTSAIIGGIIGSNFSDGMTSQAVQQGGLGLILTTLIVTAPPMAASFFQGTMGYFTPSSVFGGSSVSGRDPAGRYPGQPGWTGTPSGDATSPTRSGVATPAPQSVAPKAVQDEVKRA